MICIVATDFLRTGPQMKNIIFLWIYVHTQTFIPSTNFNEEYVDTTKIYPVDSTKVWMLNIIQIYVIEKLEFHDKSTSKKKCWFCINHFPFSKFLIVKRSANDMRRNVNVIYQNNPSISWWSNASFLTMNIIQVQYLLISWNFSSWISIN